MQAAYYERTGAARAVLQVGELPEPAPGPGEVRVRLHCSGVNPSDVKSRAGLRSSVLPFERIVPHSDGAGVIDAVGGGVSPARIGERVWIWNGAWGRANGTAAEWITLPARQAVALPEDTPLEAGACFGIPALTGLHAVQSHGGVQGKTVLVAGGAGAVGHYAVQFARLLGARQVFATVSSAQKAALARSAGADAAIDYRAEDVATRVRDLAGGAGIHRIIEVDIAANGALDAELLRPGGELVVYGSGAREFSLPFFPLIARNLNLHFFIVYNLGEPDRAAAEQTLTRLLTEQRLTHQIAERLPLAQIAAAHELVESGRAIGNVVLTIA
ncbi:NADPH:quinone reductase [Aquincola sp. S2]|uniref:NADPH:quinone reductase n=1 Tax=Pseudaquabacterium terrae TaxID=2732868 RepID=A0ABX2EEB0_9BURK|nr:NADPH:quinone reductase [Aquabacterium terrae]NRF66950.1 NADPH:quinone reductase [Aquabacterium terrae]